MAEKDLRVKKSIVLDGITSAGVLYTPGTVGASVSSIATTGSNNVVLSTNPTISGGSHTSLTTLSLDDTGSAFNLIVASTSSTALTADRTITFDVVNANRTVKLAGNVDIGSSFTTGGTFSTTGTFSSGGNFSTAAAFTTSGANSLTLTTTATTNATLPSGTTTLAANVTTTIGDIIYASATGTPGTLARLAGNTATQPSFLTSTGNGTANTTTSFTSSTGSGNVVLSNNPTFNGTSADSSATFTAFGSATSLTIGATTGTTTIRNTTVTLSNATSVNLGTSAASASTTTVGPAITGNILKVAGTSGGTINLTTDVTSGTVNVFTGVTGTLNIGGAGSTTVIGGNLTVNGITTTVNSNTLVVDDKNLELGAISSGIVSTTGTIGTVSGSGPYTATITGMSSTTGLIPGQVITATAGTGNFGAGTVTVASIVSTTSITISSTATFTAGTVTNITGAAASDSSADGGGITLKGTTDKTLIWDSTNSNWTSSENWNIASGKVFKINNTQVLSSTALGSGVTSSSLTSVGTIGTGTWQGTTIGISYGGTGQTTANAAFNALAPSQTSNSGKYLTTDGTNTSWATLTAGTLTGTFNSVNIGTNTPSATTYASLDAKTFTISANTQTTVDTYAAASFRAMEYTLVLVQNTKTRMSKVAVTANGTTVDCTEYAIVETGGAMSGIDVTAAYNSPNSELRVTVTDAATTNVTARMTRNILVA